MRQEMHAQVERLSKSDGIDGAMLVSRDGIAVVELIGRPVNQEMFAAMSAMMMGAAETAVSELGDNGTIHVFVRTETAIVAIRGATDELLLVAVGGPGLELDAMAGPMTKAAEGIRALAG
jgi:hypothetical protein